MIYHVWGIAEVGVDMEVEANTKEEAIEIANEEFGGIQAFAGNGGCSKLIGVSGEGESISADGYVEFNDAEKI